jgi:hypothetical protein
MLFTDRIIAVAVAVSVVVYVVADVVGRGG